MNKNISETHTVYKNLGCLSGQFNETKKKKSRTFHSSQFNRVESHWIPVEQLCPSFLIGRKMERDHLQQPVVTG